MRRERYSSLKIGELRRKKSEKVLKRLKKYDILLGRISETRLCRILFFLGIVRQNCLRKYRLGGALSLNTKEEELWQIA
jgi:hypothetical protein